MGSIFYIFELTEKIYITETTISQYALSKVQLNKYGSYFKFILLPSGDINLNPGPTNQLTQKEVIRYVNVFVSTTAVSPLTGWVVSLILCLSFAVMHGIYFKKGACSSFI